MTAWLGVVSAAHVALGVAGGFAQFNHGRPTGRGKLATGHGLVYYSPTERLREPPPLRVFTALGVVAPGEGWQADDGDFHPWRWRIDYFGDAPRVPIADLADRLELTATPNWGYQLRRGLIPLSDHDFRLIGAAMKAGDWIGDRGWTDA